MVYNEMRFDFVTWRRNIAPTQTEQVYDYIRAYIHDVGYPPHIQEVAAGCGLSLTRVLLGLSRLQAAGRLTFRLSRPRDIRLVERAPSIESWEIQTAR